MIISNVSVMRLAMVALGACFSLPVYPGELENVLKCVNAAKEFAGVELDPADATYKTHLFSPDIALWEDAKCEISLDGISNLWIGNERVIFDGFAGESSLDLNSVLQDRTNRAIADLKERISRLKKRMEVASARLGQADPDHASVTQYVNESINQALGGPLPPLCPDQPETNSSPVPSASAGASPEIETKNSRSDPKRAADTNVSPQSVPALLKIEAKRHVKKRLNDPGSAEFSEVFVHRGRDGVSVACGQVRAKNSFGGYSAQFFVSAGSSDTTFLEEEVAEFPVVWNRLCR